MFRKKQDIAERSRSLLKNSAAKKLKLEILAALPTLSKDAIDHLLPNKASVCQHRCVDYTSSSSSGEFCLARPRSLVLAVGVVCSPCTTEALELLLYHWMLKLFLVSLSCHYCNMLWIQIHGRCVDDARALSHYNVECR